MTFRKEANAAALLWKVGTEELPDDARKAGFFRHSSETELCLPEEHALFNLLEDLRDSMVERFYEAGIPWHGGVSGQPGNHLLSSQIQCVNALGPLIDDPHGLKALFDCVLPIEAVLPFGEMSFPRDHVVFEWTGRSDYLSEWGNRARSRGANATSADAAIKYITPDGNLEIALIEWKYVEVYSGHVLSGGPKALKTRLSRYQDLFADSDSPFKAKEKSVESFFVEPIYQLMRLHLLARAMEKAKEGDAERVRVVYAAPSRNESVWKAIAKILKAEEGDAPRASAAWKALLKDSGAFVHYDTAELVSSDAPTDPIFKDRYRHLAATPT